MATASLDPQARLNLDQNLILQLKEIIRSGKDFDELSQAQILALNTAAHALSLPTPLAALIEFTNHPEALGLPPRSKEAVDSAVVNTQIIAANVNLYLLDKEALEKVNAQIEVKLAKERKTVRDQVKRLVTIEIARRQAEILSLRVDDQTKNRLGEINTQVNPKPDEQPLPLITSIATQLLAAALPQIENQQGITFSDQQKEHASQNLTTIIIAGTATETLDLTKSEHRDEAIETALADVPNFHSATTDLYRQVQQAVVPTATPEFNSPSLSRIQVSPDVLVTKLETISVPTAAPIVTLAFAPNFEESLERAQALSSQFVNSVSANNTSDEVMTDLTKTITPLQREQLISAAISANLVTRVVPTKNGATAKVIVGEINQPNGKSIDKTALELYAMGFALKNSKAIIEKDPNHPLAKLDPNVFKQLESTYQQLEGSKLGSEIRPNPLSGLAATYQKVTGTLSGFIPGRAGQIFNAVTHPIQSLQSYLGDFVGHRFVDKFKAYISEKVISKVTNETLKQTAQFVLKEGLQKGATLVLEKLGATTLVAGLSAALGIGTGGVSLVIQAALAVAFEVAKRVGGAVMGLVNGFSRSMTGEDFDLRAAATAPLALMTGLGLALGSAASVAAASAGVILIASAAVGFFLYITIIAVAPIITTIAHLESGILDSSRIGVLDTGRSALLPPGPLPDSCPQGVPQRGFGINQGPNTGSHTSGWGINIAGQAFTAEGEAIDYGTPINTPIYATHDGEAYFFQIGDNSPGGYGNYVAIIGSCLGNRFLTTYAHLNTGNIKRGGPTSVKRGDLIGLSDNTGKSSGPHLHYEIFGLGDIYRYVGP